MPRMTIEVWSRSAAYRLSLVVLHVTTILASCRSGLSMSPAVLKKSYFRVNAHKLSAMMATGSG
jgi:hypothetical protein